MASPAPPIAKDGVIDVSGWSFENSGPLGLDGQWEFYWGRLLEPEDLSLRPELAKISGYLNLPGFWNGFKLDGQSISGSGQATLRLRLLPGPGEKRLALRLFSIPAAFKLFANGKLIAASGRPGLSPESEEPQRSMLIAGLESTGEPVDLVLQISNHYFRRAGVQNQIRLGIPGQLENERIIIWCWAMFFAGSLLIMAVYHFTLYFLRKKEVSTLYFGLYCLEITALFISIDSSAWLVNLFFPKLNPLIIENTSLVSYALMAPTLYRFYRSLYPEEFNLFIRYICDIRSLIFIYMILTQTGVVIYGALQWFAITTYLFSAYFLIMMLVCLKRGRAGSAFLFLGSIILAATSLSDLYRHIFSINVDGLLPAGLLAFVLSQAFALAQRFSNAFVSVEGLSSALEAKNTALLAEMDERTRLEEEIVNVSEGERRRLSHDLHDGLCQQLVGARLRCSALELKRIKECGAAKEEGEISSLLEHSVKEVYSLSRGLWPVEQAAGDVGPSLSELARRTSESSGIEIEYNENLCCASCENEHLVQLYRIAQEALANAVKHAKASRITISLSCERHGLTSLCIQDNGIGRDSLANTAGGLGMRIMAYRARTIGAELAVNASVNGGTVVTCTLACACDVQNPG